MKLTIKQLTFFTDLGLAEDIDKLELRTTNYKLESENVLPDTKK